MNGALERQDTQVLFSVLPGGASLYLGFMAPEGNCRSLFLQKLLGLTPFFSQRVTMDLLNKSPVASNLGGER